MAKPIQRGKIKSINVSKKKGIPKNPIPSIDIDVEGMIDDAHRGQHHRQISILPQEKIDQYQQEHDLKINPGAFGENLITEDIDFTKIHLLDQLKINKVLLEVTQIGKDCHNNQCIIAKQTGQCIMPKKGIFCRVLKTGHITINNTIEHSSRKLKILLLTMSDRAYQGIYKDRAGMKVEEILSCFAKEKNWQIETNRLILPDEKTELKAVLKKSIHQYDVIFTLGGTGIGSRDITPEVVAPFCEKQMPGIMENIRIKYGAHNPMARLSRSIAGIHHQTQLYTLPGSVKATTEYMTEILTTLEHSVFMIKNIDIH